ncbi:MAG: hypothetical protein ACK5TU_05705 [Cyclobacteriaceae bacterium]|jgi:hypothetical protein
MRVQIIVKRIIILLSIVVSTASQNFGQILNHGNIEIIDSPYLFWSNETFKNKVLNSDRLETHIEQSKLFGFNVFSNTTKLGQAFELVSSSAESIRVLDYTEVGIYQDTIDVLDLVSIQNFVGIYDSRIKKLRISKCTKTLLLEIKNSAIDSIILDSNFEFNTDSNLKFSIAPVRLALINCQNLANINFTNSFRLTDDRRTELVVFNSDLENLKIEYDKFYLKFDTSDHSTFEEKVSVYERLLKNFNSKGAYLSSERLDKEFKEFKYKNQNSNLIETTWGWILNWIDSAWWDYGYNKYYVLRSSLLFTILFFVINFIYFDKLVKIGYVLPKFQKANSYLNSKYRNNQLKLISKKTPYVIIYTCMIFWGIRLEREKVGIDNFRIFIYIIVQYVGGLICLAYIANWIIST